MPAERLVGAVLIAAGLLLFVLLQIGVGGEAVPLVIGVGFLVAYALTRLYGLLVPAGILTGLGTGIVAAAAGGPNTSVLLGLGTGFIAIAAVDRLVRGQATGQWWPLIPGGIILVVGLATTPETRAAARFAVPVALVLVGLWLIVGRGRQRPEPVRAEDAAAEPD